jgi:hypothetical protein
MLSVVRTADAAARDGRRATGKLCAAQKNKKIF